jgi:hypothetical protein
MDIRDLTKTWTEDPRPCVLVKPDEEILAVGSSFPWSSTSFCVDRATKIHHSAR